MRRREFVKTSLGLAGAATLASRRALADVPDHLWEGYKVPTPPVTNRLDQGPFGVSQDEGWYTIFVTDPYREHIRNFGTGLIGYTCGVRHAVRWACGQPTNPDGSLTIRLKKGSDSDWRKGV